MPRCLGKPKVKVHLDAGLVLKEAVIVCCGGNDDLVVEQEHLPRFPAHCLAVPELKRVLRQREAEQLLTLTATGQALHPYLLYSASSLGEEMQRFRVEGGVLPTCVARHALEYVHTRQ